MKTNSHNGRRRWTVIWLAVMLTLTAAFAQFRSGTVYFNDPITRMQNGIANLNTRVAVLEQALNKEIQARRDVEKRVAALEKKAPVLPAAKSAASKL